MAFLVREMLEPERILEHELTLAKTAIERLNKHPKIEIMGALDQEVLSGPSGKTTSRIRWAPTWTRWDT